MKRLSSLLLILMMCLWLPLCAAAQALLPSEPLTGQRSAPESAPADQAACLFGYAYPQFEAQEDADGRINAFFQAMAGEETDALFERFRQQAEETWVEGMPQAREQIDYQVVCNDDRYLSVLLVAQQWMGNGEGENYSAFTFARDGLYAGQRLTLTQVLGLEDGEADKAPEAEKTAAQALAYRLVGEIVQNQVANVDSGYLDGIAPETVESAFDPETDFYLDADGNIVFYIQPGILSGEVEGVLTFPFAPAEMLSAVNGE